MEEVVSPGQQSAAAKKRPAAAERADRGRKIGIALAVILAIVLALGAAFAAFHWLYGNDAQDIQGTWYVNGTDATLAITEAEIVLTEEVSYTYTLDSFAKTIDFQFSTLSGGGHYRFSLDRGEVAIIDGECSWLASLTSDFNWLLDALLYAIQGKEAAPAEGEDVTLLTREPISLTTPEDLETEDAAAEDLTAENLAAEDPEAAA